MSDQQEPYHATDAPAHIPAMTPAQERWACALLIEKQHGEQAPTFVVERIGALVLAGDADGVERWRSIARCLDALRSGAATA